jgi:hypothetical protein
MVNENLNDKKIGEQLIIDIVKYKEYPNINSLICFIYDPKHLLDSPKSLEKDLSKLSSEKLNIKIYINP